MTGLILAGWHPRKRTNRGRPPGPGAGPMALACEFCRTQFSWDGPRTRIPKTCSRSCATRHHLQVTTRAAQAKLKAEQAAKFLYFPKEALDD